MMVSAIEKKIKHNNNNKKKADSPFLEGVILYRLVRRTKVRVS